MLDIGAMATNRLVAAVGGEDAAGALLTAVQAAIYGVPKTVIQIAVGTALDAPKQHLAEKVSGLLQEKVFDGMGSPDSVKTVSDSLGNFTVGAVFNAGTGMVRAAGTYAVAKSGLGGTARTESWTKPAPVLNGDPYNPDAVKARSAKSHELYGAFDPQQVAKNLGYDRRISPQKAPFDSHGQPVYFDGKTFITPDVDGHNVTNGWKKFDAKGNRVGTFNSDLKYIKR